MRPLEGIKVVELGIWFAGPAAGMLLAECGADVIKIEPLDGGDPIRGLDLEERWGAKTPPSTTWRKWSTEASAAPPLTYESLRASSSSTVSYRPPMSSSQMSAPRPSTTWR